MQLKQKKTLQLKHFHSEKLFETKLLSFPCFRRIASGTIDVVKLPNSSPKAPHPIRSSFGTILFQFSSCSSASEFLEETNLFSTTRYTSRVFPVLLRWTDTNTQTHTSSTIFNGTHNRINVTWKSKDTCVVYLCGRTSLLTNWRRIWRKEARVFHPFLSESKLENAFCTWEIFLYFHPLPTQTQCQQRSASVKKGHHISPKASESVCWRGSGQA